jgi:hypothetical protein
MLCKKFIAMKSKEVKTECDLTKPLTEGCGSTRDVLVMVVVVTIELFNSKIRHCEIHQE